MSAPGTDMRTGRDWIAALGTGRLVGYVTSDGVVDLYPGRDRRKRRVARVSEDALRPALAQARLERDGDWIVATARASRQTSRAITTKVCVSASGRRASTALDAVLDAACTGADADRLRRAAERFARSHDTLARGIGIPSGWRDSAQHSGRGGGRAPVRASWMSARAELHALEAVLSPHIRALLFRLIVQESSLATLTRCLQLNRRAARDTASTALAALADAYDRLVAREAD